MRRAVAMFEGEHRFSIGAVESSLSALQSPQQDERAMLFPRPGETQGSTKR
jgi:hypothetical protein